jgi:hypothetical protein
MRLYDRCLGLNAVPRLKPHIDPTTQKWLESCALEVWVKIGVVGIAAAIANAAYHVAGSACAIFRLQSTKCFGDFGLRM